MDVSSLESLRPLHDRGHGPALAAAEWPRLGDRHLVADLGLVLLVVRQERRRAALRFAVERIAHLPLDGDLHGLVHLVADDNASDDCLRGHDLHRLLLTQHGLHARQIAPEGLELVTGFVLPHRLLNAQAEHLIVEILLALPQLVDPEVAELGHLHDASSSPTRVATRVLIGSWAAASRIASRASTSLTPSISN